MTECLTGCMLLGWGSLRVKVERKPDRTSTIHLYGTGVKVLPETHYKRKVAVQTRMDRKYEVFRLFKAT